ncbi:MAG: xylulokinase [Acidimicrobiales bacterium]
MTASDCALGIDLGTGSTKALLLDATGTQIGAASSPVVLSRPQPGWAESDPEQWWQSVKAAVRQVLAGNEARVGAIGLSGQMHGVVLARSDSSPLRPALLSLDRRALGDLDAYRVLPPALLKGLCNPLVPGMAGPLLHWLAEHENANAQEADWALQPKDWLRLRMVGTAGSEPSDASGTLLYDLAKGTWSKPVVEALGLRASLLPPLGASYDVAGPLSSTAARELGLPSGIPVAFGSADTAAALVGTGLRTVGAVQLTVGSAAQLVTLRTAPQPDPELRYHIFASASGGLWYALAAVQVAGVALSWALEAFHATWQEAYQLLEASPVGAKGALFVPHLAGARSPSMNVLASGGFAGLELSHNRADMLRAVFEGVAFSIADAASSLPELAAASSVYLAGGGSLHPAWRQLLCDVLGKPLLIVDNPNASALGAALIGGHAAGITAKTKGDLRVVGEVQPDPRRQEPLAAAFERWKQLSQVTDITASYQPSLAR